MGVAEASDARNFNQDAPAATLWTPDQLTELVGWWDSNDATTITETVGAVSQWDDKSTTGIDATQDTASRQPSITTETQNGRPVMHMVNDGFDPMTSRTVRVAIAALRFSGTSIMYLGSNALRTDELFIRSSQISFDGLGVDTGTYATDGDLGSLPADAENHGLPFSDNDNIVLYAQWAANQSPDRLLQSGNGVYSSGQLFEVLWLNAIPSLDDRQRSEGYLAHNWGLASQLPLLHPYRNSAPTL